MATGPKGDLPIDNYPLEVFQVTSEHLERMVNPLSVVHGYAQLLRRRIDREGQIDQATLHRIVLSIEVASSTLIDEVKALRRSGR